MLANDFGKSIQLRYYAPFKEGDRVLEDQERFHESAMEFIFLSAPEPDKGKEYLWEGSTRFLDGAMHFRIQGRIVNI